MKLSVVLPLAGLLPLFSLHAAQPELSSRSVTETLIETIPAESIRPVGGFAYRGILRLDRPGDNSGTPSPCVVTEDGEPLGPAHASRESIETQGAGRYLHWTDSGLFFSASDNTDPRTNGRTYALVSDYQATRHSATLVLRDGTTAYEVPADDASLTNRRLVLRNLDEHARVTVRMKTEGLPDFTSAQTMIASILRPGMSDEEKAIAIWQFLVDWRYHHHPPEGSHENHDPARFLGVYGYGYCDDAAHNFVSLCRVAGLQARAWRLEGRHIVAEAYFKDRWHMFDADHEVYFRDDDGHIMSVDELAADPSVMLKTEKDPIGFPTKTLAEIYTQPDGNKLSHMIPPVASHELAPTLQPKDEVIFDFGLAARTRRVMYRHMPPPPEAANGRLVRQVDVATADRELLIPVEWPYVILGGELRLALKTGKSPEVALSLDGQTFHALPVTLNGLSANADLTSWVSNYTGAAYTLTLRVRGPDATPVADVLQGARLNLDFQFGRRVAPQIQPGGTGFVLTVTSTSPETFTGLQVAHDWDQ